ncbi:Delta(8)-fatty-acid desaturase 2 [Bienertia sinuspersici]
MFVHMGCGGLLGMAWIQSAYLVLTGNCLTGISMAWWKRTHNAHQIACNTLDGDLDLQHILVFAISLKLFNNMTSCFYGRKTTFDPITRALNIMGLMMFWTWYPLLVYFLPNEFSLHS